MVREVWIRETIAASEDTVVVENNHYFPLEAVLPGILTPSPTTSTCPWKGTAGYDSVRVGDRDNRAAASFHAKPKAAAAEIAGRVAFWKGVEVG
jgi:uncharacterized protein (DUF427 family)